MIARARAAVARSAGSQCCANASAGAVATAAAAAGASFGNSGENKRLAISFASG